MTVVVVTVGLATVGVVVVAATAAAVAVTISPSLVTKLSHELFDVPLQEFHLVGQRRVPCLQLNDLGHQSPLVHLDLRPGTITLTPIPHTAHHLYASKLTAIAINSFIAFLYHLNL